MEDLVPPADHRDWIDRLSIWHLAFLFSLLILPSLGSMPLFEPDEGRYAEISREMLKTGDFVTPRLNGVVFFEKPVLLFWLNAASMAIFGQNELAVRLPSALASLFGFWLTYVLARKMGGHRTGVYAAIVLGTSPMWAVFGHVNALDMTLSSLVLATMACFWQACHNATKAQWYWHGVFAFSALAFLAKGLIGVVLPGSIIALFLLTTGRLLILRTIPWITGALLFVLLAAPWHFLVSLKNADFLWFYFIREHFLRFTTEVHERQEAAWFFIPVVIVGLLPWAGLLPEAIRLQRRAVESRQRHQLAFVLIWAGFILLFFSISSSKLIPYALPAFPALAIACAFVLTHHEKLSKRSLTSSWGLGATTVLLATLQLAFLGVASGFQLPSLKISMGAHPWLASAAGIGVCLSILGLFQVIRGNKRSLVLSLALSGFAFFACLILGAAQVAEGRTTKALAECIQQQQSPQTPVVSYRIYPQTLPFYLDREINVVEYQGELRFGKSKLDDETLDLRFPEKLEFRKRWNSEQPMFLVTRHGVLEGMVNDGFRKGRILLERRKYVLLTNSAQETSKSTACDV